MRPGGDLVGPLRDRLGALGVEQPEFAETISRVLSERAAALDTKTKMPATTEGAITAGFGYFGGWALVGLLGRLLGLVFRRRLA